MCEWHSEADGRHTGHFPHGGLCCRSDGSGDGSGDGGGGGGGGGGEREGQADVIYVQCSEASTE